MTFTITIAWWIWPLAIAVCGFATGVLFAIFGDQDGWFPTGPMSAMIVWVLSFVLTIGVLIGHCAS